MKPLKRQMFASRKHVVRIAFIGSIRPVRIILGLAAVILLLLTGTFILSYLAVDMSKEFEPTSLKGLGVDPVELPSARSPTRRCSL